VRYPHSVDADAPALRPKLVDIASLTLDPHNARRHNDRNLAVIEHSLGKFQQVKPIVVYEPTGVIIAGNGTVTRAIDMGAEQIVAVFVDKVRDPETGELRPMTPEEAAELAIVDNRSAELAEWHPEQLAETIGEQPDFDWGDVGFEAADFEGFDVEWPLEEVSTVGEHERGEGGGEEPPLPEPPKEPVTQTGDLWILGDHRLVCGDSFDEGARALLLDGEIADMALMDPPFAIYGSSTGIGADIADDKMIRPFFARLGFVIVGSVREFAHVYVCCDWRSWATIWDGLKGAKMSPKNALIWDKGGGGLGSMYAHCYEMIAFFVREPPKHKMTSSRIAGHRQVFKPNVVRGHNRPTGDERLHNAAKPVAMLAELIENSSDEGEIVLDLFNGSGSVIIAGERTGRRVRAMEMERAMCDVTVARWERETGRKAQLVRPREG